MDRKITLNHIFLPYLYFTFLSTGMILVSGYLLTSTKGPIKSYAQELNQNDAIQVNLSKDVNYQINVTQEKTVDIRVKKIDAYFATVRNNKPLPLTGYGQIFINMADKYGLDWTLLPAIAMKESTGGFNTPSGSNNPFGYGFRDDSSKNDSNHNTCESYESCIERVASVLKRSYYDESLKTPEEIVTKWSKVQVINAGGDPTKAKWAIEVRSFMTAIRDFEV